MNKIRAAQRIRHPAEAIRRSHGWDQSDAANCGLPTEKEIGR